MPSDSKQKETHHQKLYNFFVLWHGCLKHLHSHSQCTDQGYMAQVNSEGNAYMAVHYSIKSLYLDVLPEDRHFINNLEDVREKNIWMKASISQHSNLLPSDYYRSVIRVFTNNTKLVMLTIKFSLNYTKLATLPTKAHMGKSKINSSKKLLPVEIEPRTTWSSL